MYKIIRLTYDEVVIGLPNGGIEKYPRSAINYPNPKVNDFVEIFKNSEELIISKKSSNIGETVLNEFNNFRSNSYSHNDNNNRNNSSHNNSCGKEVNKLAYVLLAFFVGSLGIHKFYAGKTGMGILYLLFCWTGIPSIIGAIEAIMALVKPADPYGNIII